MFTRRCLLPGILLATLVAATVSLTMSRSTDDLLTLALHFPLFLLAGWLVAHLLPARWRLAVSLIAAPLVVLELILIRLT